MNISVFAEKMFVLLYYIYDYEYNSIVIECRKSDAAMYCIRSTMAIQRTLFTSYLHRYRMRMWRIHTAYDLFDSTSVFDILLLRIYYTI